MRLINAIIMGLALTSCAVKTLQEETRVPVSSVSLSADTLNMIVGESQTLEAIVLPSNATEKSVSWISSKTSVATVSSSGAVQAQSAGNATVMVTTKDGGYRSSCVVNVRNATGAVTKFAEKVSCMSAILSGCAYVESGKPEDYTFGILMSKTQGITIENSDKQEAKTLDFAIVVDKLEPSTKYYFRSYLSTSSGVLYGEEKSFTTLSVSTMIKTKSSTISAFPKVSVMAALDTSNCNIKTLEYGFKFVIDDTVTVQSDNLKDKVFTTVQSVSPDKSFNYLAYAIVDGRTYYGESKSCTLDALVDLGLSVKWSKYNLGADKEEGAGDYYAWGETETKTTFSIENYKHAKVEGTDTTWTKYYVKIYEIDNPFSDYRTILEPEDDASTVQCGQGWRMPTQKEWFELNDSTKCKWTLTTINGNKGYKVQSLIKGYTDNYIFLPAAGYRDGDDKHGSGAYWSSRLNGNGITHNMGSAYRFGFGSSFFKGTLFRYYGLSIRPVCAPYPQLPASISFEHSSYLVEVGSVFEPKIKIEPNSPEFEGVQFFSSDKNVVSWYASSGFKVRKPGKVTLTAQLAQGGLTATCEVEVVKDELVDLGLSVRWATKNVGADKPEAYGNYYAWGETEPKGEGIKYTWENYKYCTMPDTVLTKYNTDPARGTVDNKTVLDPEDDAAYVNLGSHWRTPSRKEMEELIKNCSWEELQIGEVTGYKVTSKVEGYTDKSIFLPCAGYYGTKIVYVPKLYYMTSNLIGRPHFSSVLHIEDNKPGFAGSRRMIGKTVRAVSEY